MPGLEQTFDKVRICIQMFDKLRKNMNGVITVFVVLIMVPVVVITGIMVDMARLKLFAVQVAFASDSYGEVILSEYDNVLKELYGLFAVTQNEDGLAAIEEYAEYIGYSFKPNGNRSELSGAMFFGDADVSFEYENIEDASFSNSNVLMTQVADYMEFRVVEQVLDETGVFDMIDGFKNMQNDNEAISAVKDVGDGSEKVLGEIETYYKLLVDLKAYEQYLKELKTAVGAYGSVLDDIYSSSGYADYLNFLENEDSIVAAKAEKERLEAENKPVSEDTKNLAEQYVDVGAYRTEMKEKIDPKSEAVVKLLDKDLFKKIPGTIDALRKSAKEIEKGISEVEDKLKVLDGKLANASEDVREGIEQDIKEMRTLQNFSGRFQEICDKEDEQNNKQNNTDNKAYFHGLVYNGYDNYKALNVIAEDIISGDIEANVYWVSSESDINKIKWWEIPEGEGTLYTELQKLYSTSASDSNKKSADEKKDAANGKTDDAVNGISEEDEDTEARSIPNDVMAELKGCESAGTVPSFLDYFESGFSFSNAGDAAAAVYDKFLMTEYDFGMFSSRVTGIEVKQSEDGSKETKTIVEKNLNKAPMSKNINYLYGAELEYIYGGHRESEKNLAAARNTICGVRMTMNFISTYTIKEINTTISRISTAAAEAVTATGIGAFAAPFVKVAVSAALRTAVAALETVEDWKMLKNREDVLLFKSRLEDLTCRNMLTDLLGPISGGEAESPSTGKVSLDKPSTGELSLEKPSTEKPAAKRIEIKMSYEDYLRVLLFVCVSSDTVTRRTSDLITLNVNQSQNKEDTLSAPLDFKMSDAYTAVKVTCKAKLDMVVVPDYMLDMFLGGNDTQTQIQAYDDGYIGYTMIRGY